MIEVVVASKNAGKVAEFTAAFAAVPIRILSLADFGDIPEAEENGDTFEANALAKARHYAHYTGKACLADDSGLEVDALDGAPGVYSARYAGEHGSDEANNRKLLAEMEKFAPGKRSGRFCCVLAFVAEDGTTLTAAGTCEGIILQAPSGHDGFGYDPLFYVPAKGRTFAELSLTEKNGISHRGKAIRSMVEQLTGYYR
ncbi:MAG: XTP/dITP diphosphatase [Veillonellales bacterium]